MVDMFDNVALDLGYAEEPQNQPDIFDEVSKTMSLAPKPKASGADQNYGLRVDGTPKGTGFLGVLKRPDGKVSSELSISVDMDGKETLIPSMVPTLTKPEVDYLLNGNKPTTAIVKKAVEHAKARMGAGKSPFAGAGEGPKSDIFDTVVNDAESDMDSKVKNLFKGMPQSDVDYFLDRLNAGKPIEDVVKELGGVEAPYIDPIDVATGAFGAGAKVGYSVTGKLASSLMIGAAAAAPAAIMNLPIGAAAEALSDSNHPALAFLTSLGVGIASGITVENLAQRGLLGLTAKMIDKFSTNASKILPKDFIDKVKTEFPSSEWSPEISEKMQAKLAKWRAKAAARAGEGEPVGLNRSGGEVLEDTRALIQSESVGAAAVKGRSGGVVVDDIRGQQGHGDMFDEVADEMQNLGPGGIVVDEKPTSQVNALASDQSPAATPTEPEGPNLNTIATGTETPGLENVNKAYSNRQFQGKKTKAKYASNFRTWVKIMGGINPDDPGWRGEIKGLTEGRKGVPVGMVNRKGWNLDELHHEAVNQGWLSPDSDGNDFFRLLETNPISPEAAMNEKTLLKSLDTEFARYAAQNGTNLYVHPSIITGPIGGIAVGVDWDELKKSGQIKIDPKKMFLGAVVGAALPMAWRQSGKLINAMATKWDEGLASPVLDFLGRQARKLIDLSGVTASKISGIEGLDEELRFQLDAKRSTQFQDLMRQFHLDIETSWGKALELGQELQKLAPTKLEQRRLMQVIRGSVVAQPGSQLKAKAEKVNGIFENLLSDLKDYDLLQYSRFDKLTRRQRAEYRDIINNPSRVGATPDDVAWAKSRLDDYYHIASAEEYAPLYYSKHEGLTPKAKAVVLDEINRLKLKSRASDPEGKPELEDMIAKMEKLLRSGRQGRKELNVTRQTLVQSYAHRREDLGEDVQKMLGVIEEAAFPVAKMVGVQSTDVVKGRLFQTIADNPMWVKTGVRVHRPDGTTFIKKGSVPANYVEVADERFGALNGKFVRKDIWNDLREVEEWRNGMGRLYDKVMGIWKAGKVIYNPATHARNCMSNAILAYLGDVNPWDLDVYAKAAGAVKNKRENAHYAEAKDWGLFNGTFVSNEIKKLRDTVDSLRDGAGVKNFLRDALSLPANAYQEEEEFFKMAVFIKAREGGGTVDQAARKAEHFLFNYNEITPWVKQMKRWVSPFFVFTYKALPLFAEMTIRKPHKVAALMAAIYGTELYSSARLGYSSTDLEKKRALLPDWQRKTILNVPMHVLMPFRDKWGNDLRLDLSYILPYGNAGEKWGQSALPLSDIMPSSPVFQTLAAVLSNREPFTGRDIYNPYLDGAKEIMEKYLKYAWMEAAPSLAPGGYGWNKLSTGLKNALRDDAQETDWADRPIELSTAILSSLLGIKLGPVNEAKLQQTESFVRDKIRANIGSERNRLKADLQHHRITKDEFKEKARKLGDLEKSLMEGRPKIK